MPYLIVNPLGSIHYTSKISVPLLYWYSGYGLPRISKSRRHLLYVKHKIFLFYKNTFFVCNSTTPSESILTFESDLHILSVDFHFDYFVFWKEPNISLWIYLQKYLMFYVFHNFFGIFCAELWIIVDYFFLFFAY